MNIPITTPLQLMLVEVVKSRDSETLFWSSLEGHPWLSVLPGTDEVSSLELGEQCCLVSTFSSSGSRSVVQGSAGLIDPTNTSNPATSFLRL